jgi:hypothetical protein
MSNPRAPNRRDTKACCGEVARERRFDDALAQRPDARSEGPRRALTSASKAKGEVCAAGRTVLDADGRGMGIGDALDD